MRSQITLATLTCLLLLSTLCYGQTKLTDIPRLIEESARPENGIAGTEEEVAERIQRLGPDAIPYLLPLLKHEKRDVRRLAAYTLGGMDGLRDEHLDALIESRLKGDDWMLPAIARVGTPRAIRFLIDELKHEERRNSHVFAISRETRVTSVFVWQLREKGVPYLVELIKSGAVDSRLFGTVAFIFGQLGDKAESAIDPLIEFAADREGDVNARGWAVLVLGAIDKKTHRSMPTLLALARDEPKDFNVAVNEALQDMGVPEAVPSLVKRLTEKPDRYVFSAIAGLGDSGKATGPALVHYLSSDDWDIRIAAARAMGRIGYVEGALHLIRLLQTKDDWRLVYVSAESLGRLRATDAIEALTNVSNKHWFHSVRRAAGKAILVIKGEDTYESLDRQRHTMMPFSYEYADVGASDDPSISYEGRRDDHPPYVAQEECLDGAQLKELTYKTQIGYLDPNTEGGAAKLSFKTIEQVPEVGIRAAGGYLLGSDRGEWGGELVFIDSEGHQTTLLSENVQNICMLSSSIVAVTGLSHLTMDNGILFKVTRGDDGTWHTTKWRVLPDAPLTSGPLANGNLYVGCYDGCVEVSPSGDMKAPGK